MVDFSHGEGGATGPPKRIILVEDDGLTRRMMVDVLRDEGFDPIGVADALLALAMIEEQPPDCIIADVVLPTLDGFRFRQILRDAPQTRDIPFIFVTVLSSTEDHVRGLALGVDDYLIKPVKPEVLVWKIKNLMAKSGRSREIATIDALTACYNRRCFDQKIDEEVARATRYGECFTIAMFDLDRFKLINDTWGHVVGDRILAYFADFARKQKRACDLLFRSGGDEFLMILPRVQTDGGVTCANRIRESLDTAAQDPSALAFKIPVTVSGGVATFPTHGADRVSVLESCEEVLHYAKELGRNRVEAVGA